MIKNFFQINQAKNFMYLVLTLLLTINFLACGSSGGGDTTVGQTPGDNETVVLLTGVAATGNAMTGNVSLKDSEGTVLGPDPIAIDGSFSFNVHGLVPPYYLVADDGNGNRLYSIALSDGIANINPFTNVICAAAAGVDDPAEAFNDPAGHPVTQGSVNQAITDLRDILLPLLRVYDADVNPITDPFSADHTGLDALFNNVNVELITGMVTFSDNAGNQLAQASVDLQTVTDALDITVSGNAFNEPDTGYLARLNLNVDGSSLDMSELTFAYKTSFFSSTSIIDISDVDGIITIIGTGDANGVADHTFTAEIRDNDPDRDEMGMIILKPDDVTELVNITLQPVTSATDFTVSTIN